MTRVEDLTRGAKITGIRPDGPVEVLDVKWYGTGALELTYKGLDGKPGNEVLYRDDETRLEVAAAEPA